MLIYSWFIVHLIHELVHEVFFILIMVRLCLFGTACFGIEMTEVEMFDFHFLVFMSVVFGLVFDVIALIFEFHHR